MKILNLRYHLLTILFVVNANILSLHAQKIGYEGKKGGDISWTGEFLFDGTQLEPFSRRGTNNSSSTVTINKDRNFVQFMFSFPDPLEVQKVKYVRVTFHLDGNLNNVVDKGKVKYDSYRQDPSNLSHDNFAGSRSWEHFVKPNQFSVELRQNIKQGNYFYTYYFNCVDASANLELRRGASDNHFYYDINFDINLIKAEPSDLGGKSLRNDLNAENTLKIKGGGEFVIPGI